MASRSTSSAVTNPSLYYYQPNVPITIIGVASFAIVAAVHLWRFIQRPAWHFWAMYIGLFLELVGFLARAMTIRNPTQVNAFVVSYLAFILAPSFMAAACYTTFGRILWWVTPPEGHRLRLLWCPTRLVTTLFVLFDLSSFFIQFLGAGVVGAAYTSNDLSAEQRQDQAGSGLAMLKLGFALQLVCFSLFVVVGGRFLFVSRRWVGRPLRYPAPSGKSWARLNWVVNIATMAITIRAIYRMVEFSCSDGRPGYLLLHEWPFWVFDAAPMLGVFIVFALVYPGQYLPPAFLIWWLNVRKLSNEAKSSPPHYSLATVDLSDRMTADIGQRV